MAEAIPIVVVGTVPSMPVTQTSSTQKNFDFVACSAILTGNINILYFSIKFHILNFIHWPIPVLSGLLFEHALGFFIFKNLKQHHQERSINSVLASSHM